MNPATLRAWRTDRGLSRKQAADLFGIHVRTLDNLESGRSPTSPLFGAIARIVELLNMPVTAPFPKAAA